MKKGQEELLSFTILTQPDYEPNWHHELIAQKLEAVERGEIKRLMIFMPPRHGKSELASIKFPAWYLGRNPKRDIIACSYNDEFAEEFGRKVRNVVRDEKFKLMFNEKLSTDSKRMRRWTLKTGGGYVAAGVGGSITGRGADLFIIDDPIKNREEAASPTYRQRVWDWYTSTAYTRLHPGGAIIVILTRWHDDDLAGRLLELENNRWDVLSLPAIATKKEKYRNKGEALWPSRYNLDILNEIRDQDPYVWASLYQQNPVISETQEFKKEWFQKFKELPRILRKVTTVDPAISKRKRADESVVMTCGMDATGRIHILEYTNRRMNPTELIDEIFRHHAQWKPEKVGIEAIAYQKSLTHFMKIEMKKRQTFLNMSEMTSWSKSKDQRIRALIPYYQHGMVLHSNDCKELEEQLMRFPSGKHDDIADALSMQLDLLSKPAHAVHRQMPRVNYDPLTGSVAGVF